MWVSDRTLCYLASGRPTVVERTVPSAFLPDDAGLFRFRDPTEAVVFLKRVAEDYQHQSALARSLAEAHFDTRKVIARTLELVV